jgi:site-specific DNA-methyltransferase (adenine-specific)
MAAIIDDDGMSLNLHGWRERFRVEELDATKIAKMVVSGASFRDLELDEFEDLVTCSMAWSYEFSSPAWRMIQVAYRHALGIESVDLETEERPQEPIEETEYLQILTEPVENCRQLEEQHEDQFPGSLKEITAEVTNQTGWFSDYINSSSYSAVTKVQDDLRMCRPVVGMNDMEIHPVAKLFPMISDPELAKLAIDIKENGLRQAIVVQNGMLLDGRNRLEACRIVDVKPRFEEFEGNNPEAFIISANIHRRHLTESQRAMIAAQLANMPSGYRADLQPSPNSDEVSLQQAANLLNVGRGTVADAKFVLKESPELAEQVTNGEKTIHAAKKELETKADQAERETAQKAITDAKRKSLESVCDLRVCSCADLFASGIKPDVVITDPPYSAGFLPVFSELAQACRDVPLVAVMSGQSYLPGVIQRLCEHLKYRWTLAYLTPGGQSVQQFPAKINCFWKPVLLFGEAVDWIGDVSKSAVNDNDKRFHEWGQSESGMADLIERLTKPGQLICDPFLGGGTTAVVSLALGRRFVGCDIDADCVARARQRIEVANG